MTEVSPYITYLEGKRLTPETATPQQLSDAKAYEACYNWYISRQKVQPSVAELAAHTFIQKYALHDASGFCMEDNPEAMWIRIADVLAGEEVKTNPNNKDRAYWFNEFASILVDFKYSPQGSGLYSLGNSSVKASASNCFVVPSPSDSLESIFDTAKFMARIYAARGGVGVDISDLRPFGATTNNAAKSSTGAASFMDFYSHVTSTIGQAGRRGALMLSIRVDHPDIFRFIEMKRDLDKQWFFNELSDYGIDINDWKYSAIADRLKSTSHANVSVRLNDKFIKAVENDEQFELYFDFADNKYPRISQFVRARDIWDKLIEGATEAAEPGMLNWDKITSESPADCYSEPTAYVMPDGSTITYSFKTLSTNPCITSDGYVKTAEGYKQVKDLLESPWTAIVNGLEYQATPFWKTGDKEVFSIACENGSIIKATKDHTFLCSDNIWRKVSDLLGHTIKQNKVSTAKIDFDSTDFKQGWLIGSIVGDGFYTTASGSALMYWGTEAESLAAFACSCLDRDYSNKERNKVTVKTSSFNSTISKYIEPNTKELKPLIYAQSDSFISGFLSGLIDADGSVQGTQKKGYSLRISQSNVSLLEHCQRLLFTLGINSRIYRNRRPETTKYWKQGNKNYTSKAQHELVITSNNLVLANSCLSLKSSSKHQLLESIVETTSFYNTQPQFKVSSVKSIGIMPVYDCTVDTVHCFDLNGAIAHNCGELPLSAGDSCCLGTHNLPSFVRNPYTPNAKFDWMEFKRVVFLSTRAQDNIKNIDIDLVPLEINRQSAILGRRIGLGCTGLSDALAMLGFRYDSPKALAMTEKIYSVLRDTAYASSIELASEKGAFLAYTPEKEVNNPFLSRLPENLQNKPRRNIALLTNAPNGSMAIIMNNGSSGIEPCFKKEYLRNVKVPGTNDFRQFQVYHQPIADCIAAGGDPSVFIEANDVSGEMRIKLQATIQKYIDHSISVTTNLPAGTTKERVSELYLQAFKEGCKGFTVYVDGCRTGVLTSIKEPVKIHKTLERPKTTNIDIHKVKYKDKQWAVLVGRADNGPLEVFAGIEEETPLPNKYHRAELTKKSRGHYSLTVFLSEDEDDLIKISNIGARFPSPEGMTLTRFISLSLKHGVPVGDICEQLTKSSNSMFDYPAVLNRVLKNYVSEDEYAKKNGEKTCPDCGSKLTFRKVDGCMVEICGNCSYTNSKCG